MEISEKIGYINEGLNQGKSLKQIAGELSIGYSTIKEKLSKGGFKRVDGVYVLQDNSGEIQNESVDDKFIQKIFKETGLNDIIQEVFNRLNYIEERLSQGVLVDSNIVIDLPDDSEHQMSGRVNETIYREWQEWCSQKKFKSKDLLSMALKEYMENHKDIED